MSQRSAPVPPVLIMCGQVAALALARRLGRAGVRVGVWEAGREPGAGLGPVAVRSRHVAHAAFGGGEAADDAAQAASLERAAGALGGRPVLLPTSDAALRLLSRQRARLRASFRFLLPAHALLEQLLDKRSLHALAAGHGIATPVTWAVEDEAGLWRAAAAIGYPCLLKSAHGQWSEGKVVAADREGLRAAYRRLAAHPRGREGGLMLQEYLAGGAERVALYNAYFSAAGAPVAVFTGRKLRQWPAAFGTACRSEARPMPGLAEPLTAWLRALGYVGPIDIGLKWDARAGVHKLLDVNPRLGQNYRTYVACGRERADLGWLAYRELAGLPLPAAADWPLRARRRQWRLEDNDWRARRARPDTWGERWRWWTARRENAYWDWRDPAPFLARLPRPRRRREGASSAWWQLWGKLL